MTNLNTSDFFDQEKKNGNGIGIIGMMNETEQKKVISSSELVGEEENVAAVFDANQALADCNKDIKEKELEISSTDNNNNDTNDNEHFIINNNNQYIKNDNNNNNSTLRQRHVISLNNNNNNNNNNDTIVDRPNITNSNSTKSPLMDNLRTKELLSPTSGTFVSSSAGEGSSRGVRRDSQSKIIENNNSNSSSEYECNICFDTAGSPVLTVCGHLFCWPCLHQWLEAQSLNPLCPVCKAGCGQDKVIPIYGRGKEAKDPRKNSYIPNRPAGQRPRPQRDPNLPSTQFFPGLNIHSTTLMPHFSISVSTIFPAVFSPQITFAHTNGPPSEQQAFLSRILFMLGVLILICFYFN